ncbi:hypothetical protein quinque_011600 [Culex quinquefasciatus]
MEAPVLMSPRWCYVLVAVVLVWPPPAVTAKSRNRVQKWQQRTWRSRFGAGPKSDWKFEGEGKSDHRKENLMAGARFGAGLSQDELDLLADRPVPNGYSNFHYRFDDLRRSHRRKTKHSNRVKRFAVDSDEEPVQFQDDLLENAPFVFGDNYPQDQQQGLSNDLVDLDLVRDEDEELGTADIDFMPMQPPAGHSQKLVTVDEDDPFPHANPKNNINRKNVTEKVQYTLIIHHGQHPPLVAELGDNGVAGQNLGTPLLVLLVVLVAASQRLVV